MRRAFLVLAVILAITAIVAWAALGANRGWTRTSVAVKTVDEVTGIEGIEYQKKVAPGIDLLGAALLGAGCLAGASFFFRKSQKQIQ